MIQEYSRIHLDLNFAPFAREKEDSWQSRIINFHFWKVSRTKSSSVFISMDRENRENREDRDSENPRLRYDNPVCLNCKIWTRHLPYSSRNYLIESFSDRVISELAGSCAIQRLNLTFLFNFLKSKEGGNRAPYRIKITSWLLRHPILNTRQLSFFAYQIKYNFRHANFDAYCLKRKKINK